MTTRRPDILAIHHRQRTVVATGGTVTMTTESSKNDATTLSRTNFSGYVEHMTIFS